MASPVIFLGNNERMKIALIKRIAVQRMFFEYFGEEKEKKRKTIFELQLKK